MVQWHNGAIRPGDGLMSVRSGCQHGIQSLNFSYLLAQANREKERLEAKQRQERNAAEAAGKPWQPRWFEKV